MSHSVVIVTNTQKRSVGDQLAPFDENREVPAYDRECYCVGQNARRRARELAQKQLGTSIDKLREEYWAMPENERPKWSDHIKELVELEEKLEKEQPDYNKPDPDDNEDEDSCHGTGFYKSTYNPDSKWDWYQVGGRWSGYFKIKPDAEYKEVLIDDYPQTPEHMKKMQAERRTDVASVKGIDFEAMGDDIVPFAILHNGEWFERGSMGWWGMVSDEKDNGEWEKEVRKLLSGLDEDVELTAVDVHI